MGTTIKARFTNGVLELLEDIALKEGEEVNVTIESAAPKPDPEWLKRSAGGWVGLVDGDELKRNIRKSRDVMTRPEPKL